MNTTLNSKEKTNKTDGFSVAGEKDASQKRTRTSKPVVQYTIDGKFIKEFNSTKEAAEALDISMSSINHSCLGRKILAKGYIFLYASDLKNGNENELFRRMETLNSICQINSHGKIMATFLNFQDASAKTGITSQRIIRYFAKENGTLDDFVFLRWADCQDERNLKLIVAERFKEKKEKEEKQVVVQLSLTGEVMAEFKTLETASQSTAVPQSAIYQNCIGVVKVTHGFVFLYKRDYGTASDMKAEVLKRTHRAKATSKNPGIVFTATNKITGITFVGMSVYSLDIVINRQIIEANKEDSTKKPFYKDLQKYGADGFNWTVVDTADENERLKEKRKLLLSRLISEGRGLYNVDIGEKSSKTVLQFNKNGNLVGTFPSAKKASNEAGIPVGAIRKSCLKNCKTAYGYVFLYSTDFKTEEDIQVEIAERSKKYTKNQGKKFTA